MDESLFFSQQPSHIHLPGDLTKDPMEEARDATTTFNSMECVGRGEDIGDMANYDQLLLSG